jgi:hypothetical protein
LRICACADQYAKNVRAARPLIANDGRKWGASETNPWRIRSMTQTIRRMEMATKKSGSINPRTSSTTWFAIMLDYEVELTPGYWPVRAPNINKSVVEQEYWIVGNPTLVPASAWIAELQGPKGLADQNSRAILSGGLYRFRPKSGGGA